MELRRLFDSGLVLILLLSTFGQAWAITLGGTEVPKERFIVFILIGHSNMIGRNNECDKEHHPRLWNFKIDDGTLAWLPAEGPLFYDGLGRKDHGTYIGCGPGMHFLKRLAHHYPQYYFGTVQYAWSGARVADFRRGGEYYEILMPKVQSIQEYATLGGILAMLGRMERSKPKGFAEQVKAMVSEWRQGLGKPHLPYFQQRERPYDRMAERLRAQQKLIQTLLDDAIVLKTDGPEHHKGHFDGLGMRRWGIEAADAFIEHDWLSLVLDDRFY